MRRSSPSRVGEARGCGRRRSQTPTPVLAPQAAVSDQERKKMKRKGDRYSMQTSLIVAALKRLLPVGLNICAPGDQELIALAKNRLSMVSASLPGRAGPGRELGAHPLSPAPPAAPQHVSSARSTRLSAGGIAKTLGEARSQVFLVAVFLN